MLPAICLNRFADSDTHHFVLIIVEFVRILAMPTVRNEDPIVVKISAILHRLQCLHLQRSQFEAFACSSQAVRVYLEHKRIRFRIMVGMAEESQDWDHSFIECDNAKIHRL